MIAVHAPAPRPVSSVLDLGRYVRKVSPKTRMVLAEPGSWTGEGIGEDFVPPRSASATGWCGSPPASRRPRI